MKSYPNCKINLGLRVLRRRTDGYHDLATIFLPVPLCDELEILPAPDACTDVTFTQTGIPIDCPADDNICVKAYRLLRNDFPHIPYVKMHLEKIVPFGAGLGGGSSDAAFTLKMLNEMFSLGLSREQLKQYAARLGADCAFFIDNQPAYATGIGDVLTPLSINPIGNYQILLAKPDEAVSTREAYSGIRLSVAQPEQYEGAPSESPLCQAVAQPISNWRDSVVNDFEATVFPLHPAIADLKSLFYRHGALYACMSGSGATVLALFPKGRHLPQPLLDELNHRRVFVFNSEL